MVTSLMDMYYHNHCTNANVLYLNCMSCGRVKSPHNVVHHSLQFVAVCIFG